jgi:uncharacterized membrane protein (DUF106 family)
MYKKISMILLTVVILLSFSVTNARAQGQANSEDLKSILNKLDISTSALRKGDIGPAKASIRSALLEYETKMSPSLTIKDNALNQWIKYEFTELAQLPIEENIFTLRSDVVKAAGLIGVYLSPLYNYALFVILAVAIVVAFVVTYLTKYMVNWQLVKENKAKISEYYKEYREAMKARDVKAMHKIKQRQVEIMKLQNQNMVQTLKPTIVYIIPLFLLWITLTGVFGGWVVAWMPFVRIDLPFYGPLVTFGVGWWYFITYMSFSQIFRKMIIGD